jgi:hypothetical protein
VKREHDIVDVEVADVLDETLRTIVLLRDTSHDTNAARDLDAVATLMRHTRSRLPELVADARDQTNSWAEIAELLGISRLRAVVHYALHSRNRRKPLELD